jgi:hypothetical protein
LQRIGTALFRPKGIPTTISQVAFNAEAGAIDAIVKAFPANGNAVGTAATGCGPDVKYTGYRGRGVNATKGSNFPFNLSRGLVSVFGLR